MIAPTLWKIKLKGWVWFDMDFLLEKCRTATQLYGYCVNYICTLYN